jgi:hypothetical protein
MDVCSVLNLALRGNGSVPQNSYNNLTRMAVFWVVAPCSLVDGATTQKTAIFVLTAVRTSNPT